MKFLVAAINHNNINTPTPVNCVASCTVEKDVEACVALWVRTYGPGGSVGSNCRIVAVPLSETTEYKLSTPPLEMLPFKA